MQNIHVAVLPFSAEGRNANFFLSFSRVNFGTLLLHCTDASFVRVIYLLRTELLTIHHCFQMCIEAIEFIFIESGDTIANGVHRLIETYLRMS